MGTSILVTAIFCPIVILGNVWYCKKNKQPINWNRGWIMAAISAVLILGIGYVSENV